MEQDFPFLVVGAVFAWPGYEAVTAVVSTLERGSDSEERAANNTQALPAQTRPGPTAVPPSTRISQAASSVISRAAAIVQQRPTATSRPTATPAPTPTRPPQPTPTAVPPPKALMLELIN